MIQIGDVAWVDPAHVIAVYWDGYTDRMPLVILPGNHQLRADYYAIKVKGSIEQRQEAVEKLLKDLGKLPEKPKWPGFNLKY